MTAQMQHASTERLSELVEAAANCGDAERVKDNHVGGGAGWPSTAVKVALATRAADPDVMITVGAANFETVAVEAAASMAEPANGQHCMAHVQVMKL